MEPDPGPVRMDHPLLLISEPVQHLKFYSFFLLWPEPAQNESFTQFFSKNCGFQRQSLWSLIAMSEILYPVKRVFRVNCREAARGGFLQVKKPPCIKKYGTGSQNKKRWKSALPAYRTGRAPAVTAKIEKGTGLPSSAPAQGPTRAGRFNIQIGTAQTH